MTFDVGIDVGNSDTKSSNTTTPSGFLVRNKLPFGTTEYLKYQDMFYIPDEENKFPYKKDKTTDQNAFILSLFGIAKQLIYDVRMEYNIGENEHDKIQSALSNISSINLGVGLPPSHCATLGNPTLAYYREHFGNGIGFSYFSKDTSYDFNLQLSECKFFAQDWAAVMTYHAKDENFITNRFQSYYAVDIGGYTVDVVPIRDKKPNGPKSVSLDLGVLRMYDHIITLAEQEYGQTIRADIIESVLKNKATILDEEVVSFIRSSTQEWVDDIIRSLVQADVLFDSYPVVFLGGGAELFKTYIKKNKLIKKCDFIFGANINAKGYKKLIHSIVNRKVS